VAENSTLIRIKKDGTRRSRVTAAPVLDKFGLSPDGKWVIASLAEGGTFAIPVHGSISPGADPSTYLFTKTDLQRNLFRIPLHRGDA